MSDIDTAPSRFVVDPTTIREYARAVSAHHPAHWCEKAAEALGFGRLLAPPTFASLAWEQARSEILDSLTARYRADRIVHVDQALDVGRPLLAGDVLDYRIHRETFHHFRDYDVVAIISVLTDQHGRAVQRGTTTLLVHTAASQGPEKPSTTDSGTESREPALSSGPDRGPQTAISFDRLRVGSQLPCVTRRLTSANMTAFARLTDGVASTYTGDRLPVTPGTFELALAASYLSSWAGDPTAIIRYRVESAYTLHYLRVSADDSVEIRFSGRVIARNPLRRTVTVAIDARCGNRKLFGYATADIAC